MKKCKLRGKEWFQREGLYSCCSINKVWEISPMLHKKNTQLRNISPSVCVYEMLIEMQQTQILIVSLVVPILLEQVAAGNTPA